MEIQDSVMMAVDDECWFLEMPLEIRLNIYGYLVAPCSKLRLGKRKDHLDFDYDWRVKNSGFNLSILAVSHQIYREASPLFYHFPTLFLEIEDIHNLDTHEWCMEDMMYPHHVHHDSLKRTIPLPMADVDMRDPTWRFDPMWYIHHGTYSGEPGHCPYEDDDIWGYREDSWEGYMEPHVFTQFQKICVNITTPDLKSYFRQEFDAHSIRRPVLGDFIKRSRLFRVLTKLLSIVKVLKKLEVIVDIDEDLEQWGIHVSERATLEALIQSELLPSDQLIRSGGNGFLYSLGQLSNVQDFELKVVARVSPRQQPAYRKLDKVSPEYRQLGKASSDVVVELKSELSARVSNLPVVSSNTEITRRLVEVRGRNIQCSKTQLQAIGDEHLTPEARGLLLETIELQKLHQEKMSIMNDKITSLIEDAELLDLKEKGLLE